MFDLNYSSEKEILDSITEEEIPMLDNLVNRLLNLIVLRSQLVPDPEFVIYMTEECFRKCLKGSTEKHKEKEELGNKMTICGMEVFILKPNPDHFHLPYRICVV